MVENDYKNGFSDGFTESLKLGELGRLVKEREKGRVEGAKTELQNCIKDLEASLEFYECDYRKFEQQVVDKVIEELTENINKFKKRLKNLENGIDG